MRATGLRTEAGVALYGVALYGAALYDDEPWADALKAGQLELEIWV